MKLSYRNEKNANSVAAFWGKKIDGKSPYQIEAKGGDSTEIFIMDVLGWPFNDINELTKAVSAITTDEILVRLNTPGGDIVDTLALFHAFKNHPAKVIFRIEALSASAGTILMMAADEIQAYSSSLIMIHNSLVYTAGNQYELMDTVEILKKIDSSMVDIYHSRTNLGKRELVDIMKAETWYSAKEAKANGIIDTIIKSGTPAKANFDMSMFTNTPKEFEAVEKNDDENEVKEPTDRKVEKALRDAGLSRSEAKAMLAGCKRSEDIEKLEDKILALSAKLTIQKINGVYHG